MRLVRFLILLLPAICGVWGYSAKWPVAQAPPGAFGKLPNPLPISPANDAAMTGYPRTVTFKWSEVPGATQYGIEIDCYGCCAAHDWCTNVGKPGFIADSLKQPTYTFNFWGDQPGRWRVWAIGPHSNTSEKSQWSEFTFGKVIDGKLIPPLIPPADPAEVIACKPSALRSTLGPGTIPPKPIYKPDAEYSDGARRDKLNGSVELGVDIGEDGSVRAVCVARSLRADLDGQAVGAVKTWRFEPARKYGVTIPWYAIIEIDFKTF